MPDQHYEWVSVSEASRRLGRSVSTIRRQIETDELVGARELLAICEAALQAIAETMEQEKP